jgi:hypothetical protein
MGHTWDLQVRGIQVEIMMGWACSLNIKKSLGIKAREPRTDHSLHLLCCDLEYLSFVLMSSIRLYKLMLWLATSKDTLKTNVVAFYCYDYFVHFIINDIIGGEQTLLNMVLQHIHPIHHCNLQQHQWRHRDDEVKQTNEEYDTCVRHPLPFPYNKVTVRLWISNMSYSWVQIRQTETPRYKIDFIWMYDFMLINSRSRIF